MLADGTEAVAFCKSNNVDVALLDVRMPNMNGVEATRLLTEQTSGKPLILTTFDDDEFILEAVKSGARGYLLKNNDPERIRDAIKSVYNNHHVLQDVVLDKIKSNLVAGMSGAMEESVPEPSPSARAAEGGKIDRSLFSLANGVLDDRE